MVAMGISDLFPGRKNEWGGTLAKPLEEEMTSGSFLSCGVISHRNKLTGMRVQNVILLGILALVSSWPFAQAQSQVPGGAFRIYTYDSMAGKEGFAAQAISAFKKKCECEVELKAFGDASQVLNRVEFEVKQGSPTADVVLGVDQNNFARTESWRGSFSAATQKKIKSELNRIAAGTMRPGWIPLDWGVYAWMSDNEKLSERKTQAPERMDDLLKPEFKRRL
jgi:ABC-type thiamine transport system substrate-binding protein